MSHQYLAHSFRKEKITLYSRISPDEEILTAANMKSFIFRKAIHAAYSIPLEIIAQDFSLSMWKKEW
jgi:hypothetical protein